MDESRPAFLLTGATGFLGRRVLRRMLQEGSRAIVLARSGRGLGPSRKSAQARVAEVVESIGCAHHSGQIRVIDADVADIVVETLARQIADALQDLGAQRLVVVNVAASLKMDFDGQQAARREATRQLNLRTNVEGLGRLIQSLDRLDELSRDGEPVLASVVHFSTCYAHGRRTGLIEESALNEDVQAENSYELSKREGEFRMSRWQGTRRNRIPVTILRPSIVTGPDTRDGFLAWLNILSEPVVLDRLPGWIRWIIGVRAPTARLMDVGASAARRMRLPFVPLLGNAEGVLDLIDAEDVDRYSWLVIQRHQQGGQQPEVEYLHLSNPQAPTLRKVVDMTLGAFGHADLARRVQIISGFWLFAGILRLMGAIPFAGRMIRGLYTRTSMLRPYMLRSTGTRFDTARTAAYFARIGVEYQIRPIDTDYVRMLLDADQAGLPAASEPQFAPDESGDEIDDAPVQALHGTHLSFHGSTN